MKYSFSEAVAVSSLAALCPDMRVDVVLSVGTTITCLLIITLHADFSLVYFLLQ
jgi:hypothetical protein